MSIIFNAIYLVLAIFYLPALILKGKHKAGFLQRLGIYSSELKQRIKKEKFSIWLHAVSVGEIKATVPLIEKLRDKNPGLKMIISTITPTGNKVARGIATKEDIVIYFPFDLSWIVKKVFSLFSPKLLLIMETELWPNALKIAAKKKIKTVIVNGRISDKAFPRYQRARFLFKPIIKDINLLCMQTDIDIKRILELGADEKCVHRVGNIKFDQISKKSKDNLPDIGLDQTDRLILAGSTHDNEEEQIVKVFKKLKEKYSDIRLLIAPRHVHRVNKLVEVLKAKGLSTVLISELRKNKSIETKDKIFILDIMGVLSEYYQLSDIVFVGGSLIAHGGQNPIEPAILGKPIIFGKYMFNFAEVANLLLDNNAAVCVNDSEELILRISELLTDKAKVHDLVNNAARVIEQNQGSVQRICSLLSAIEG